MKKPLKTILIIFGICFILYNILGQTGVLTLYANSTISNEPNLKLNSIMVASNLVNPKNGDFICYKYQDSVRVHRLCGKENEIVEIKNGILFINKKNADSRKDFIHFYKLSEKEYQKIKPDLNTEINFFSGIQIKDTVLILLSDNFAKANSLESRLRQSSELYENRKTKEIYNENWSQDNFGPLTIPANKVFVLGDNRDMSEDSRFIGLVDKSDIVGTIIIK